MSIFVLAMFWIYAFCAVMAAITLISTKTYPRKRGEVGVGFDTLSVILHTGIAAWAAYLYWGQS